VSLLDTPFVINAADPGRDAAVVGVKLAAWRTEKLRVYVAYNGEFRSNAVSNQISGGLLYSW
jgi:subtilase-type serine protease